VTPSADHDPVTIGLDIGGTKIAGAVVDGHGRVLHRVNRQTDLDGARDPDFRVSRPLAEQLVGWCNEQEYSARSIGLGVPEYVDLDGLVTSRLVMDWDRQPRAAFESLVPVSVDSDVRCAALAEARLGSGRDVDTLVYVSVGTGLSHAIVIDGDVLRGARGEAISLGELGVPGRREAAGLSLEQFSSGAGITDRYTQLTGRPAAGARDVASAAAAGDTAAQEVLTSAAEALGEGLATLVKLLDPHIVILGGGMGTSSGPWRTQVDETYARAVSPRPSPPPLAHPRLGKDAGVIGAALSARVSVT
jgi:glucokinase